MDPEEFAERIAEGIANAIATEMVEGVTGRAQEAASEYIAHLVNHHPQVNAELRELLHTAFLIGYVRAYRREVLA